MRLLVGYGEKGCGTTAGAGQPRLILTLSDGGFAVLAYADGWVATVKKPEGTGRTLHRLDHGGEMSPAEAIAETKRIVRRFEDGEPQ